MKYTVAASKVAEREVLVRTQELEKLRPPHSQALPARNTDVADLKM